MKEFKTIDEQIELLKQRGLIINDEERAKKYLLSQNYYNLINGYAKFFPRNNDHYTANTSFDEITRLHNTLRKRIRLLTNKLTTISTNDILKELGFPENWHISTGKIEQK